MNTKSQNVLTCLLEVLADERVFAFIVVIELNPGFISLALEDARLRVRCRW